MDSKTRKDFTPTVYDNLKDNVICRELDFVRAKGKNKPVRIFDVLQFLKYATEKHLEIKMLFETGLSYYRNSNRKRLKNIFFECKEKYNDELSKVFIKRIAHYQRYPPKPGWNGVFVISTK